ncbi:MAG: sigma-54 dependent transcriptional regulator [Planctomycetota bacterium]
MKARLLVVDDDPTERRSLAALLRADGHAIEEAETAGDAVAALRATDIDLVLTDVNLGDADGLTVLREARARSADLPVIFITGYASLAQAVQAIKAGADDYISKPVNEDAIRVVIGRSLERVRLLRENAQLKKALAGKMPAERLIGSDPRMQQVNRTVEAVADTRATVLITGESGTGKTLLARSIHARSSRKEKPFVEVNCGALPENLLESELFGHVRGAFTGAVRDKTGKFEYADGGTIFLDEISTASHALQVKLLRVLQDRVIERVGGLATVAVDVRVILATNQDLAEAVRRGDFREDLYYRINVVTITLPSLRERSQDIPTLAEYFLRRFAAEHNRPDIRLSRAALQRLVRYSWPGNVRELENAIERAVILAPGSEIEPEDLPPDVAEGEEEVKARCGSLSLKQALEDPEKLILQQALEAHGWNRQRTAAALQVNRTTLFNKMKKYGLLRRR